MLIKHISFKLVKLQLGTDKFETNTHNQNLHKMES
jgi:hypothetical protein